MTYRSVLKTTAVSAALALAGPALASGPNFTSNVIVDGSLCVGFDCVVGMAFGFDTIVMQENNLRLLFNDTSTSASFPPNDWRLTANDSSNGGDSHFSIEDATAGRFVMRVFAGARSNALVVDSQGDLGLGTATPAVDIDIKTGNTPTVRLQQDGTSGFTAQTWDMAGNEAGFFIRDATGGSQLPFRIRPGADSNALFIDSDNDVGLGTASPDADLEIQSSEAFAFMRMTATAAAIPSADITYTNGGGGELRYNIVDGDGFEMSLNADGDLTITGVLVTTGGGGACTVGDPCDAVFDPAVYDVPSIEEHAALMWENKHLPAVGPTGPDMPINMTEKMLRMLNELEHAHIYIEQLNAELKEQGAELDALRQLIAAQ